MERFLGMPPDWSDHGYEIDRLIGLVHWLMLILFVCWAIYFIYVLFRFRAGRNPEANYQGADGRFARYAEVGVVVAEAVLLLGFAIPIWASRVGDVPSEDEAFVVRVVGAQFQWNVHYPGPDGVFGRTDPHLVSSFNPMGLDEDDPAALDDIMPINQIYVPVNRKVRIDLTARDVIHSFNLPNLRIKQDVIPGMTIPVWFIARQEGQSEIACAQLCGLGHFRMRGFITTASEEAVAEWLVEQSEY